MARPAVPRSLILRWQRSKTKRTKLWAAMRMLRSGFTIGDLVAVCELDRRNSVQTYLGQLRRAGFVRAVARGNEGRHEQARFIVTRDLGPKPPALLQKRNSMYDPNTEQEFPFEH